MSTGKDGTEAMRPVLSAVYHGTRESVATALAGAESPGARLAVVQAALQHVEESVNGVRRESGVATACAVGCSFCCWLNIDVLAHEVLLLAAYLKAHRTPWEVEELAAAAVVRRNERAGLDHAARQRVRKPCLLLDDAVCSVYPVRPGACRRYWSGDLEACHAMWEDPEVTASVEFPLLQETGRAAAAGVHHAFVGAGYDGCYYDLPSALAEALTDPGCLERWCGGEKVFSEGAETRTPEGFRQAEALERLRQELGRVME
jgi:hypothetical protein